VARGLYGPLIIEEREPVTIDRELIWVLDDWRLGRDGQIAGGFANMRDVSHAGRIGNTLTVNGPLPGDVPVRAGERLRLRLINAANARTFALDFGAINPTVISLDGQPVKPHRPAGGLVVLGAAMRADLILYMTTKPGTRMTVTDRFYRRSNYRVLDLVYGNGAPLRAVPLETTIELAANTMPEPDLAKAERHDVAFAGGMMGSINGVAATGHVMAPLLTLTRGRSHVPCITTPPGTIPSTCMAIRSGWYRARAGRPATLSGSIRC